MAVSITVEQVLAGFTTDLPDTEVELAILIVDQADTCLDANAVADGIQEALKLYAARHILTVQANSGRGAVTSESAPSGASRSYGQWKTQGGSPYWGLLKQLDVYGCVSGLLENQARVMIKSVGGSYCE